MSELDFSEANGVNIHNSKHTDVYTELARLRTELAAERAHRARVEGAAREALQHIETLHEQDYATVCGAADTLRQALDGGPCEHEWFIR